MHTPLICTSLDLLDTTHSHTHHSSGSETNTTLTLNILQRTVTNIWTKMSASAS